MAVSLYGFTFIYSSEVAFTRVVRISRHWNFSNLQIKLSPNLLTFPSTEITHVYEQ